MNRWVSHLESDWSRRLKFGACCLAASLTWGCLASKPLPVAVHVTNQQAHGVNDAPLDGSTLPPRTLVFTYDDGPDDNTVALAQFLHDSGISATFFINGCRILGSPSPISKAVAVATCDERAPAYELYCDSGHQQPASVLAELVANGHSIANHSEDHANLVSSGLTEDELVAQFAVTQSLVDRYLRPNEPHFFRAPFGSWDARVATTLRKDTRFNQLVGPIQWDIWPAEHDEVQEQRENCCGLRRSEDETDDDVAERCGGYYMDAINARPDKNGIILFHDRYPIRQPTFPLLLAKALLRKLKEEKFNIVPLSTILNAASACGGKGEECCSGGGCDGGLACVGAPDQVHRCEVPPPPCPCTAPPLPGVSFSGQFCGEDVCLCGLAPGDGLFAGQGITSCDKRFLLKMQTDGNLVLGWVDHGVLWSTGTVGYPNSFVKMQTDGNLVVGEAHISTWSTDTSGSPGAFLVVQNDGNLVVYGKGWRILWQSETGDPHR